MSKLLGLMCTSFQEKKNVLNMLEVYPNRECANFQKKKFIWYFFF